MAYETKIINFIAGPSAGKTALAGQLFGFMKNLGLSVAYVPEFCQELAWEGNTKALDDQLFILGVQHQRQYRVLGQVEWIVADSPLIQQLYYNREAFKKYDPLGNVEDIRYDLQSLIMHVHNFYDSKNFYVERNGRKFRQEGRFHNEEQSLQIDKEMLEILESFRFDYTKVGTLNQVLVNLGFF